jgi:hypothetical protein
MELAIPPGYGPPGDSYEVPVDQVATAETEAANAPPVTLAWRNEDRTSFPASDIAISVVLFREDGHPDGRLVQIVVQNFGETRAGGTYRERQLSLESPLDRLQANGINPVVQQFWMLLEEQRQKAARSPRVNAATLASSAPASAATPTSAVPTAASQPVSTPAPRPQPAPVQPQQTQFEFF